MTARQIPEPVCPKGFTVRAMTASDVPQALVIEREAHFTPWSEQAFFDALHVGDILPMVLHEKDVVAYGVLKILWREAELLNLSVAAPWRRHGLGRFLVRHLLWSAVRYDAPQVFLEVRESNIGAQALYRQMGFIEVGTRKAYYAAPGETREDALLMRWQKDDA